MKRRLLNRNSAQVYEPNTFIGGVGSTINTPALVADKLGVSASDIKGLNVVGSDVEFYIDIPYSFSRSAFESNTDITYYRDEAGNVLNINGGSTFRYATNLTEVKFPNCQYAAQNVTNGNLPILDGCTSLTSVIMPSLLRVEWNMLRSCTSLSYVSFPLAISIERQSMYNTGITDFNIPLASEIKLGAFWNSNLSIDYANHLISELFGSTFRGTNITSFSSNSCSVIGFHEFRDNSDLLSISLPNVTYMNHSNFYNCSSLQVVNLPSLISMDGGYNNGTRTFAGSGVSQFIAPELITVNGDYSFSGAVNMELMDMKKCTNLADPVTSENTLFLSLKLNCIINVHEDLLTVNSGNVHLALEWVKTKRSATVNFYDDAGNYVSTL